MVEKELVGEVTLEPHYQGFDSNDLLINNGGHGLLLTPHVRQIRFRPEGPIAP